ncbi:type IV secretory system conjugative DNA transfer family protein, partial [Clostridium boliviensis]
MKDLDVRVNTIRSRGIQLVGIFQNIPQFEDKYGKLGSKSIDSSCDTTIFLGTKNDDTNQAISKALGTTTIRNISFSKKDHGAGVSESYTSRPLMYPEEVRALRDSDELLIIQTGRPPMKLKKHMYFKQKKWQRVLAMETHWSNIEERD